MSARVARPTVTRALRRLRAEEGQGIITVMFAAVLVMGIVIVATTAAALGAVPARTSTERAAALAAAQGAIQDFLVRVSNECADGTCPGGPPADRADPTPLGAASFTWSVRNRSSYVTDGFLRVEATGTAGTGSRTVSRTLVADISAGAQLPDYLYYSTYETLAGSAIDERNAPRTIAVERAGGFAYEGTAASGPIVWDGAGVYSGSNHPDSSACDALWYDSPAGPGRASLGSTDPGGMIRWGETGTVGGTPVERGGDCEVTFTAGSEWNGKVYSRDALMISSGTLLSDDGPVFRDDVQTGWAPDSIPAASASEPWRTFPALPGSAPGVGSELPESSDVSVQLPAWTEPAAPTCVYTGPTRVVVEGSEVVVTSPQTAAAAGDPCYESVATGERGPEVDGRPSVLEARVPLTGDVTILVRDADVAGTVMAPQHADAPRSPDDSVFWKRGVEGATVWNETPLAVDVSAADPVEAWTDEDRDTFLGLAGVESLEALVQRLIDGDPADDADAGIADADPSADLGALLDAELREAIGDGIETTEGDSLRRYEVEVEVAEPESETRTEQHTEAVPEASTDVASATRDVTVSMRTTRQEATATVRLAEYTPVEDGDPVPAGDPRDQFTLQVTRQLDELGRAEVAVEAFPIAGDRTPYAAGRGDIYVEGELDGNLSLVAAGDIVVTGDIVHTGGGVPEVAPGELAVFASDDALALIAQRDVSVYHPVGCHRASEAAIAATTEGFCPDDITGLYSRGIQPAFFDEVHPSRQYADLAATPVSRIDAMIMALGGSFVLSNYDRGLPLGTLTVNGAIYQEHRGATGIEWETLTTGGARPTSGYVTEYRYDGSLPHKPFPFVPGGTGQRVGSWSVTGISEGEPTGISEGQAEGAG